MRKYLLFFKMYLMEYFVYRVNFFLWRFREIISFLILFFFWETIYRSPVSILGYSQQQMLTYIVGVSFLRSVILSTRTADLAAKIKSGDLVSNFLSRPWSVIKAFFVRDLSDKFINTVFTLVELFLLIKLLNFSVFIQKDIGILLIFIFVCFLSLLINFYLSFLFSVFAFWIDNIWAPRWLLSVVLLEFMSGLYFPLDVLPKSLVSVISFTPFPYLIYFPLKIFLGQISLTKSLDILFLMLGWLLAIYYFALVVWKKGLKAYSAYGG